MKHRQIKNIIENEYSGINILYDEVVSSFKPEDIHLFRIEIKKLRAFLRLISTERNEKHELKLPKKLHEFYDAIGVIRSLQIQQQHFEKVRENNGTIMPVIYSSLLHTMIANNIALEKDSAIKEKPVKKGKQELLSNSPGELKEATIRSFIETRLNTIKILLRPVFLADKSLHSIRKILTDIVYTWPYINIEFTRLAPPVFPSEEAIISITQLLGNFQDICICLHLLHAEFIDCEFDDDENFFLRQMEKKWLIDKEITREEIHEAFQKRNHLVQKSLIFKNSIQPQLADKLLAD